MVFTRGRLSDAAVALSPRYYLVRESDGRFPVEGLDLILTDNGSRLYEDKNALPRFTAPWPQSTLVVDADIPTRLKIEVATPASPSNLIIRDQWYPGWKAYVNGYRVEIKPEPYVFRTVTIPAGPSQTKTTVEMRFQPDTIFFGIYCLCLGAGLFAAALAGNVRVKMFII
jgi:hypothetical protein